jgi:H+/gluconate symporter-like permease
MKPNRIKSTSEKVANIMIVAMVVGGTVVFGVVNNAGGGELMSKLFIAFLGAIITIQVIPGLLLLWAMIKGAASVANKSETAEATVTDKSHK